MGCRYCTFGRLFKNHVWGGLPAEVRVNTALAFLLFFFCVSRVALAFLLFFLCFTRGCLPRCFFSVSHVTESSAGNASSLALPETMDADQEEQLRQQKEMQRLEARIRDAAARQAMPGAPAAKAESEAERRMRELYEERLKEYGELATVDGDKEEEERRVFLCRTCWWKCGSVSYACHARGVVG